MASKLFKHSFKTFTFLRSCATSLRYLYFRFVFAPSKRIKGVNAQQEPCFPGAAYLWIEIKSLQSVDDQRVLCQLIVHDHVDAAHEGRSLDNGLVVGIVEALEPDNSPLQPETQK